MDNWHPTATGIRPHKDHGSLKAWTTEQPRRELHIDERARWLHRLANLVPLNRARNSKALNYDFDRKKSAYFVGTSGVCSYALTSQVLHTNGWTPTVVAARQDALLEAHYHFVLRLNKDALSISTREYIQPSSSCMGECAGNSCRRYQWLGAYP
ncbi:HNH endonuclease family protein [Pseudomonas syringae]|uniref:HNH endonuclease family protein n=1 Tax=Pseudomonas syringae TaxID=317 RepID=UPI003F74CFE6